MTSSLKAREERKREACWNAAERWRTLQDTITWAAQQITVRRNTREACLAKQARLLRNRVRSNSGP